MAKKGIHPDYHNVLLILANGKEIVTRSTFGKENDRMISEVDIDTHPAWSMDSGNFVNERSSVVAEFRKVHGNIDLAAIMKSDSK